MKPAFDINTTTCYSLKDDTDEVKTIFHIGVLDAKADAYLNTQFRSVQMKGTGKKNEDGNTILAPEINIDRDNRDIETVALGLKGVENFPKKLTFTEKNYPFGKRTVLTEESLNYIKPYIEELSDKIRECSTFTGEAAKN